MSKRTNGEGSIDVLPSGRYRGRVAVVDDDGRLVRRAVTGTSRKDVLDKIRALRAQADAGKSIRQGNDTVRGYFDHWKDTALPAAVGQSTVDQYRSLITTHALPVLGDRRMVTVKPSEVEALVHNLPRSESTRRSLYAALRKMWDAALRDGITTRNPVSEVTRPTITAKKPAAPAVGDVKKVLEQAKDTRMESFVMLLVITGARRGELLGCRWSDVEKTSAGAFLNINGSLVRASDGLKRRPPKTAAGTRRVPLPRAALQALNRQRILQAEERLRAGSAWIDSGFIFTTPVGGAIEPRNASRDYAALCSAAKVEEPGMHAMRHYVATVLLDGGSSAREVADQLGHSSPMITLELYAATVPESQRAAVERAASLLGS